MQMNNKCQQFVDKIPLKFMRVMSMINEDGDEVWLRVLSLVDDAKYLFSALLCLD